MSSRKVAPANLGFAQNANIVGRTLYRKNTAVEAIMLNKYYKYIQQVKAAINDENKTAIQALTDSLKLLYDNDDDDDADTGNDTLTLEIFGKILKLLSSSSVNNNEHTSNKDVDSMIIDIWNIIFLCVKEYVENNVTKQEMEQLKPKKQTQKH